MDSRLIKISKLQSLPYETLFNILLNLDYDSIANYCLKNRNALSICHSDYFWQQKAFIDFSVSPTEFKNTILTPILRYIELLTQRTNKCVAGSERSISSDICLYRASGFGNIPLINYFLNKGATSQEVLNGAAASGNFYLLHDVLEHVNSYYPNLDVSLISISNLSLDVALSNAANNGQLEMVKYLIEKGANNLNGALRFAAIRGNLEIIKYLISKGANEIQKAVRAAADHGHLETIKYLISLDVNNVNDALLYAGKNGYLDIIQYAISQGGDINIALRGAGRGGQLEIVKYLISQGANDLNKALSAASYGGYLDIVQYLISQGANDLNEALSAASYGGYLDIVQYLISQGTNDLNNALESAARNGHLEIVQYLISQGANNLHEALESAATNGYLEIIKYLLAHGANLNVALGIAANSEHLDIVEYLLSQQGTNVNGRLFEIVINKILMNEISEFKVLGQLVNSENSILRLTDNQGNIYIITAKYNSSTNEILPPI